MHSIVFLVLFLSGLAFRKTAAQRSFSCTKEFWPELEPGDSWTVSARCKYFPGYHAKKIEGTTVSVAYTESWGKHATKEKLFQKTHTILEEAFNNSLAYYGPTLGNSLPPSIVLIISLRGLRPFTAETVYPIPEKQICEIKTFEKWTSDIGPHAAWAKQALAHELYHCVFQLKLANRTETSGSPGSLWVAEGSANYFSNIVFPRANREWPQPETSYNPSKPIYAQDANRKGQHVYGTSIYFQALEQSKGNAADAELNRWALSTIETDTGDAERNRLSMLSGFADDLFTFSRTYTPGPVIDSGGGAIPSLVPVVPKPVSLSAGATAGTQIAELRVTPFTITTFELSIAAGSTAELLSYDGAHHRLAYRFSGQTVWTKLGARSTLTVPCNDNNTPQLVLLLFTSTQDATQDKTSILITQPSDPCPCKSTGGLKPRDANTTCPNPPTSPGSCKATGLTIDPCLTAHDWQLDKAAMKAYILDQMGDLGVESVDLSGSGTVSFTSTAASFVYQNFIIDLGINAAGLDYSANTVVDGVFDADVIVTKRSTGSTGDMCMIVTAGHGSAVISTLGVEFEQSLGPDGGYVSPDYDIKYTCSADSLVVQGYQDGALVWGPMVYSG